MEYPKRSHCYTKINTCRKELKENIDVFDFELNEEEMKQISSLDMGYSGSRTKHFDVEFVENVFGLKKILI